MGYQSPTRFAAQQGPSPTSVGLRPPCVGDGQNPTNRWYQTQPQSNSSVARKSEPGQKDVSFERDETCVAGGYTKNRDPRRNPMTTRLREMLTLLKGGARSILRSLMFGPYRDHKAFRKARDAAQLGKDVVFHILAAHFHLAFGNGWCRYTDRARTCRTPGHQDDHAVRASCAGVETAGNRFFGG